MKVAEALLERSSLQRKLEQLRERAEACARYQEGEEPPENLTAILTEADQTINRIETLIAAINRTNSSTQLGEGGTITDAIAARDMLKARHSFLSGTADALTGGGRRAFSVLRTARTELKFITAMPPADVRRQADEVAVRLRLLDARIQKSGWETDLLEN